MNAQPVVRSLLCGFIVFAAAAKTFADDPIEVSVVKLNVTKRPPNYNRPWTREAAQSISGSGVVIDGKRILTNAHMVANASQVLVKLRQGGDQLGAKVKSIAPGIDLAVLELDDPEKLKDVPALQLTDDLPQIKSQISAYGYPTGGDGLSITQGIVSRIEFTTYYYATGGVRVQVDAALNPGNSGGPAIQDGKIVGLVFSGIQEADNIGYLIPPDEIRAFLADVADGAYAGIPMLYDDFQSAENPALRSYAKMPTSAMGVVVTRPYCKDDSYPLKQWDVVTHIGSHAIDNQGFVDVRGSLRMRFLYYVPRLAKDDHIDLTVLRNGKPQVIGIPTKRQRDFVVTQLKDQYPDYFICGPLAFTVASQEIVQSLGKEWMDAMWYRRNPLIGSLYEQPSEPGEQLVIVADQPFPHPMARAYENPTMCVVARLNGIKVKNLRHLAELVRDSKEEFLRFEMGDRMETLVFRRQEMIDSTDQVLVDEGIRYGASESLRNVWKVGR